ncbi:MAG: membrane-bound lytic murein transglycosylase D [Bacteroidia bacterium]|jgi:membrane-bound lytic murein transglycosylase D
MFQLFSGVLLLACTLVITQPSRANSLFPLPAELEADVAFWVRVYTQIDTNSGFIHDASKLGVVYETLNLTGRRTADNKQIKNAKIRLSQMLNNLADNRLTATEQEKKLLQLLGSQISASELRRAAKDLRFQRGQSDRFRDGITRSGEWHDYIERVMSEHDLPLELAALPHVESSFNLNAYSSAGAAGIWQFTRSTGRRYLHIDYVLDERMDPFASTVAAAQLLQHNLQLTGSWPLALTAYNHGAAGVRRAKKTLGTSDIATIVRDYKGRAFGFASRNFYVSFLAALEVSSHPKRYFGPVDKRAAAAYTAVEIPNYISAAAISEAFNTDIDELKRHNRSLLDPVWIGKKHIPKGFMMRVPSRDKTKAVKDLLASIPSDKQFAEQTLDVFHKVVPGDTVSEIASRYGHSARDVVAMNGLNRRYQIRVGQVLRLPLEGAITTAEVNTAIVAQTQQAPVSKPSIELQASAIDDPPIDTISESDPIGILADPSDYTVTADDTIEIQATETLGHYAEWLDLRASGLRRLNGMPYGRPLVIGHRLKLDFSRIKPEEFERRRLAYQSDLQQNFFMVWQIHETKTHVIARGESLWLLTRQQFKIPMWLLRQYNPDLNLDKLQPGTSIVIPQLVGA